MKKSYYTKKEVLGDDPLMEIIYEIEDVLVYPPTNWDLDDLSDIEEEKVAKHGELKKIFERHKNTIEEYKRRNT